ncbi:hypothetical protein [Blastococcus sp. CT_GayMR16]|uniref:AMIN-like domain-containing (lipo)protein n=1 Tax=Blastococcus sp. CT_GayMR16 TaxID=2559607 RepID=UPI0010742C98|nr:hypothetical protein [Blastococcus sp. CT_GayMR16]TFV83060.1 hypothetical protein E4P38_21265 [Blastococcus sp. CT_GayMR16]
MTRTPIRLLVLLAASFTAIALAVPAQAAAPYCGITWGSTAEQGGRLDPAAGTALTNVRAGRHTCYDRLVLDIRGRSALSSWRVEYVDEVTMDPSGEPVALGGGAFLQIVVGANDRFSTPANRGALTNVSGFTTFRQVAWAGSFEGLTSVGLGVRALLPFRVLTMTGIPGSASGVRVVVDVAHRW